MLACGLVPRSELPQAVSELIAMDGRTRREVPDPKGPTGPAGRPRDGARWHEDEESHEEIVMGERRDVVVVGVDGSESSATALRWAFDEAERADAELEVVCAWGYPERSAPFLLGGPSVYDAAAAEAHDVLHQM